MSDEWRKLSDEWWVMSDEWLFFLTKQALTRAMHGNLPICEVD